MANVADFLCCLDCSLKTSSSNAMVDRKENYSRRGSTVAYGWIRTSGPLNSPLKLPARRTDDGLLDFLCIVVITVIDPSIRILSVRDLADDATGTEAKSKQALSICSIPEM